MGECLHMKGFGKMNVHALHMQEHKCVLQDLYSQRIAAGMNVGNIQESLVAYCF